MEITKGRVAPPVIGEEWREFTRPPLYLLLALGLLLIALAYQVRGGARLTVDVGTVADTPYLTHFNDAEVNKQLNFRWSRDVSALVVPGAGRDQALDLTMSLIGERPAGQPTAALTVTVGGRVVATLAPAAALSAYTVTIPASLNAADSLTVTFTANAFTLPGDPRKLGVVVDALTLAPSLSSERGENGAAGLVRPPNRTLAYLLATLLLLYLTLRHLRLPWKAAWATSGGLLMLAAGLLMFDRYDLTVFALPLLVVMVCVYGLALLLPPLVEGTLTRLGAKPGGGALQALMLIYLAAFAIRAGGMMHPQFQPLDHEFRAHQVQELVSDPAAFWDKYQRVTTADEGGGLRGEGSLSMLGQWHLQVPFPYSPIAYYIFAPFGLIWPNAHDTIQLVVACDTLLAALVATLAFALYALAKRGLGSGRAGVIAAAVALFAPVSYLQFSDGGWPPIIAGWLAVVYIMAAICLAERASKPLPFVILSLLAGLTLASHTAIALFSIVLATLMTVILLLMRRQGSLGFPLWPLLGSFLVGAALSLVYYGAYVVPLLTVTLPTIIAHLGVGVGQEQQYLGHTLLTGFWPQVWAHFTVWPLLLGAAGLGLALCAPPRRTDNPPADGTARLFRSLIISWALLFALFSVADLKLNLLQRHMLFVLPLLGLLSGYALVRLMPWDTRLSQRRLIAPGAVAGHAYGSVMLEVLKREWFGWLVTVALVGFLFVVGWEIWLDRVLHYVLPPGSG